MRDINLLPQSCRNSTEKNIHVYLLATITGILLVSVIYFLFLFQQLSSVRAENAVLQETVNKISGAKTPVNREDRRAAVIRKLDEENPKMAGLIEIVFAKAPAGLHITRVVQFETRKLIISGTGNSNHQITSYTEELKKIPQLKNLAVKFIQEASPGNYTFELQGLI